MARKSKNSMDTKYIAAFVIGIVVGAAVLYAFSAASYSYPGGYMMPMMRGMMGYQYSGTGDCSRYTEAQLEQYGDTLMIQMMGREFEEQMDARLSAETSRLMHLMMGRMYLGC